MVERFHRTLKGALICHNNHQWTKSLSTVLLGIRTAFKEDLQTSAADMIYGECKCNVPGEFFDNSSNSIQGNSEFLNKL